MSWARKRSLQSASKFCGHDLLFLKPCCESLAAEWLSTYLTILSVIMILSISPTTDVKLIELQFPGVFLSPFVKDCGDISSLPVDRDRTLSQGKIKYGFKGVNNFLFHCFQNFGIYIIAAWTFVRFHIIECFQYVFGSYFQIMQYVFREIAGLLPISLFVLISSVMV